MSVTMTQQDHDDAIDIVFTQVMPRSVEFLVGAAGYEYWKELMQAEPGDLGEASNAVEVFGAHREDNDYGGEDPPARSKAWTPVMRAALKAMKAKPAGYAVAQHVMGLAIGHRIDPRVSCLPSGSYPCAMAYTLTLMGMMEGCPIYDDDDLSDDARCKNAMLQVSIENVARQFLRRVRDGYARGIDDVDVQMIVCWVLQQEFVEEYHVLDPEGLRSKQR